MTLDELTQKIRDKVGEDSGLDASIKFVLGDEGVIVIDATVTPNVVTNEDRDAQCTITVSSDDFTAMLGGELDPMAAFMGGKIQVEGDMAVAMKLGNVVG